MSTDNNDNNEEKDSLLDVLSPKDGEASKDKIVSESDSVKESDKDQIFDLSAVEDITTNQGERLNLRNQIYILISVFSLIILHGMYTIYDYATDDSIITGVCPESFELDQPVKMRVTEDLSSLEINSRIKSFVNKFIIMAYPRTSKDTKQFYTFAAAHSLDSVKIRFDNFLNSLEDINKNIDVGSLVKVWVLDEERIAIRKSKTNESRWKVVIPAVYHAESPIKINKSTPEIILTIVEKKTSTLDNVGRLYVAEMVLTNIVDSLSGEKNRIEY
jgi:hypothetical protein